MDTQRLASLKEDHKKQPAQMKYHDFPTMNENNFSFKNASTRRTYHRRNRKNRTNTFSPFYYPVTTTILTTNSTLLINSPSVPINDIFALSYIIRYKHFFLVGLSLLIFLCFISIIFLLIIFKCRRTKNGKTRRQQRLDKQRLKNLPDFLDEQHDHKNENDILLDHPIGTNILTNNAVNNNGSLPNDNISNTFSLDPMLEQKIVQNNPPNAITLSLMADDTSLDTLRGSLISSPSQQISNIHPPPTPTSPITMTTTTTDSKINPDERAMEVEKDDDLHDLDLKRIQPRFIKAANSSSSNLPAQGTSGTSLEQSIRRQERRAEEEERRALHGSNSNLIEKELRTMARKQHTNSQVSLVSRTSEDSCY